MKFGYMRDEEGYPAIDPVESVVVRRMFELYADGTHPAELARILNAEGHTTRTGLRWGIREIRTQVANPIYVGKGYYNRTRRRRRDVPEENREALSIARRPEDEWIEVSYPPIVSKPLWESANAARRKYKHIYQHKGLEVTFPLRGLAWCGFCGNRLYHMSSAIYRRRAKNPRSQANVGSGNGKFMRMDQLPRRREYRCAGAIHKKLDCRQKSYAASALEERVWKEVRRLIEKRESVEQMIRERERMFNAGEAIPRMKRYDTELKSLATQEERAISAFVKELIDEDALEYQLNIIRERQGFYRHELEHFRREFDSLEYQLSQLRMLGDATAHLRESLDALNEEERGKVINLVCEKVVVSGPEVIVHYKKRGVTFDTLTC